MNQSKRDLWNRRRREMNRILLASLALTVVGLSWMAPKRVALGVRPWSAGHGEIIIRGTHENSVLDGWTVECANDPFWIALDGGGVVFCGPDAPLSIDSADPGSSLWITNNTLGFAR